MTKRAIITTKTKAIVDELYRLVIQQGYRGTIGVVSPFRAQAELIQNLCNDNNELAPKLNDLGFLSDTVHKFQGDERDLMVFSPVISDGAVTQSVHFLKTNGNNEEITLKKDFISYC